jgi:hypothetical protein
VPGTRGRVINNFLWIKIFAREHLVYTRGVLATHKYTKNIKTEKNSFISSTKTTRPFGVPHTLPATSTGITGQAFRPQHGSNPSMI